MKKNELTKKRPHPLLRRPLLLRIPQRRQIQRRRPRTPLHLVRRRIEPLIRRHRVLDPRRARLGRRLDRHDPVPAIVVQPQPAGHRTPHGRVKGVVVARDEEVVAREGAVEFDCVVRFEVVEVEG